MANTDDSRLAHFRRRTSRWTASCEDDRVLAWLCELFEALRDDLAPESYSEVRHYHLRPPTADSYGELLVNGVPLQRSMRSASLLGTLMWAINQLVIRDEPDALRLHAAGAADRRGNVVVLPAPMEAGKTTLVTGLLDRGLAYLSDEAVTIEADGTVHGYPKPLSIDRGSWEVLSHHRPPHDPAFADYFEDQWLVPPQRFTVVQHRGPLAAVVFPRYEPGAPTGLTSLGGAEALELAMAATFQPEGGPLPTERIRELAGLVSSVPTYRLVSGSLKDACDAVEGVLDTASSSDHSPAPDRLTGLLPDDDRR